MRKIDKLAEQIHLSLLQAESFEFCVEQRGEVMFKKRYTRVPLADGDAMKLSLKGEALICAVEAGLVPETEDGSGYNIGPFLKFWEAFSVTLPKGLNEDPDELEKIIQMIEEHSNQRADQKQQNIVPQVLA